MQQIMHARTNGERGRGHRRISISIAAVLVALLVAVVLPPEPGQANAMQQNMVIENNNSFLMAMGSGSRIELHAVDAQKESWSQLATSANAGSSQIEVQEVTGWEVGDQIAIASTSNNWEHAEEFIIDAIAGRTITLNRPLEFSHRGETVTYENDGTTWDVEIRAEVALLNRNIKIQGDEDSVDDGFGAHTMIMEGAAQHVQGVEYYRAGQRDLLGRYPLHWHLLDQVEGQYVEGSSVHESYQKGITVHGTSNARVEDNVIYDHVGHGVFFEDGAENNNQIIENLVFSTQRSETGLPIPTDAEHASSYWIENPNNMIIGNHAAGSESNGFWIFENQIHGESARLGIGAAGDLRDLIFIDNVSHTTSGDAGAGGTDKILGIDGVITNNLDFRQSTRTGEFGIVEGFTGYAGASWALTHELVFSNNAYVDVRFFARHENIIQDTLFDNVDAILYRDGGNQYNNVYATNRSRFLQLSSDHVNTTNPLNNVTLDGGSTLSITGGLHAGDVNQQSAVDIDGSITGIAGGFVTPDDPFKAAPGAIAVPSVNGLVSSFTVGATEVTALGIEGNVRIVRSDGTSMENLPSSADRRNAGDDPEDRSDANYEFYTTAGMERDLAYLLDLDQMPAELTLNLTDVRAGDAVVYEIPGIAGTYRVTNGGVRVLSFSELLEADETTYYRDNDTGSVFVRIVAVDNGVEDGRRATDLLADYRSSASISMDITGYTGSSGELSPTLLAAIDASAPDGLNNDAPEISEVDYSMADYQLRRYGSTSDTIAITPDMARWSDNIWGANAPVADNIVHIGPGETVVLDQSAQVKGIVINGGELIVEDDPNLDIELSSDFVLVVNGGLFQAGTETDLLDTNFTLTLEGDDPNFDLDVTAVMTGQLDGVITPTNEPAPTATPQPTPEPTATSQPTPRPTATATATPAQPTATPQPAPTATATPAVPRTNSFVRHGLGAWTSTADGHEIAVNESGDGAVIALKDNGVLNVWRFSAAGQFSNPVAIGSGDWASAAVAIDPAGRVEIVATKADGRLFTMSWPATGGFDSWTKHGRATWDASAQPAIATNGKNVVLTAVKADGRLFLRERDGRGVWGDFVKQGLKGWAQADVDIAADGDVWLIGTKTDGRLYIRSRVSSTWSTFAAQGLATWSYATPPSVSASDDGVVYAAIKADGRLFTRSQSGGNWANFASHGRKSWVAVSIDSADNDAIALLGSKDFGRLYSRLHTGGSWQSWSSHGLDTWSTQARPSVSINSEGATLLAVKADQRLFTRPIGN